MENEEGRKPNTMSRDRDPYYFSHYANMARHNAYLIISDITDKMAKRMPEKFEGKNVEEESLDKCTLLSRSPYKGRSDDKAKATELLVKQFPFLRYFQDEAAQADASNKPDVMEALGQYLKDLSKLRNRYSHYNHPPVHFSFSNIQEVFEYAFLAAKMRMQQTIADDDYEQSKTLQHCRPLWTDDTEKADGIYFFLCLFLEKKYAFQFLSKLEGFKDRRSMPCRATLEVFTQLCCKLPYPKLESADMALDILNELGRCPHELYNVLSKENQKAFIAQSDLAEDEDMVEEEDVETPEPIMKRYESRFPYFALRYFDKSGTLDGISFQLHLGRMKKEAPHEKVINGEVRQHQILKEIQAFGRLSDYEGEAMREQMETNPNMEFYSPKYNINGNRIALTTTTGATNKEKVMGMLKNGKYTSTTPQAILSTHELAALFFYNYLYKKGRIQTSPKELIDNYIRNFHRFIEDLQSGKIMPIRRVGQKFKRDNLNKDDDELKMATAKLQGELNKYGLKAKDLPDVFREYLLSYKPNSAQQLARHKFKKMWKETEYRLQLVKDIQENGFRRSSSIKNGEMAQELARDIVFLTRPHQTSTDTVPQKINDLEFDVLQKALAYFPVYKEDLRNYLAMLIGTEKGHCPHPFLLKVMGQLANCRGLMDFYKVYYTEQKNWLSSLLVEKKGKKELGSKVNLGEWEYFLKLKPKCTGATNKNYSPDGKELPVYLPTGLFNEGIRTAMGLKNTDNAAYALKVYFEGKTQAFYELPRFYKEEVNGKQEAMERDKLKEKIKHEYLKAKEERRDELKNTAKRIRKNESAILVQQTEDRALFLMIADELNIKNADIERIGFNLQDNNLLDEDRCIQEKLYNKTITAKLPVKRYGEFRRFLKDRRLENLLKYYDDETIPLGILGSRETPLKDKKYTESNLVDEIELYDKGRMELTKKVLRVEELLELHYPEDMKKAKEESGNKPNHWAYVIVAQCLFPTEVQQSEELRLFRNKLFHNELPYEAWTKEEIRDDPDPMKTRKIFGLASKFYDKVIEQIGKQHGMD